MADDLVKRLRAIDKDIILRRFEPEMSFDGLTAHKAADRIEKLEAEVERLRKALTTRFTRSSPIEEKLMSAGVGKRPLPTAEECLEWAAKLGIPDEYRGGVK